MSIAADTQDSEQQSVDRPNPVTVRAVLLGVVTIVGMTLYMSYFGRNLVKNYMPVAVALPFVTWLGINALLKLSVPGLPDGLAVLSAEQPVHELRLREAPVSLWSQVGRFIWLGMEHIWIGYDHIMFLLALIVIGQRLAPLVKIVTAFTVAHSLTLILATLEWVVLPSRLVEAGIALSIVYVAAENFWLRDARHRWILTFCFGFVHGFGFANVLRDLNLPSEGLIATLLAFNIGVEIGQVSIVTILFPVILWMSRRSFHQRAVQVVSGLILLFGVGWLVERLFDLSYMPF